MLARLRRLFPSRRIRTLASLDAYARWAMSYPPHAHNPLMQVEEQAMLSLMPDLRGCIVLDLACGTGRYSRLALERGARLAVGLDNSLPMIQAGHLASPLDEQAGGWAVGLATIEAIPLSAATVDVVLCGLALGHVPSLEHAFSEISRVLKPGGQALVSDFHPLAYFSGGRRTFTASDGQTYAVEHHPHLYADYHLAASDSGLQIKHVLEPGLPGQSHPIVIVFRFQRIE